LLVLVLRLLLVLLGVARSVGELQVVLLLLVLELPCVVAGGADELLLLPLVLPLLLVLIGATGEAGELLLALVLLVLLLLSVLYCPFSFSLLSSLASWGPRKR
jgi:hypothetical protein